MGDTLLTLNSQSLKRKTKILSKPSRVVFARANWTLCFFSILMCTCVCVCVSVLILLNPHTCRVRIYLTVLFCTIEVVVFALCYLFAYYYWVLLVFVFIFYYFVKLLVKFVSAATLNIYWMCLQVVFFGRIGLGLFTAVDFSLQW